MHGLDVDLEVRRDVPRGPDVWGHVAGRERCHPAAVDVYPIRRRRWQLASVNRSTAANEERPSLRKGSCFAADVSGVELADSGVEVVELEHHECHDPFVSIDLDDDEEFASNRLGVAARGFKMREDQAPTPGRNDRRRQVREADVGGRLPVFDLGISSASEPGIYDATAIV